MLAFVLLGSCAREPTEVYVVVGLVLPPDVRIDRFRFWTGSGVDHPKDATFLGREVKQLRRGVIVPADGTAVLVTTQAIAPEGHVVAEGAASLNKTVENPSIRLERCLGEQVATEIFRSCFSSVSDGGSPPAMDAAQIGDVLADLDAEGTDGKGDASGGEADEAPPAMACQTVPLGAQRPVLERPAKVREACEGYCRAMDENCSYVYGTHDRCIYACELLQWPVGPLSHQEDSINCRRNFALAAEKPGVRDEQSRQNNCSYASVDPLDRCGSYCEVYCRTGNIVCPGWFPPDPTCARNCQERKFELERASPGDAFGTFIGCRLNYLKQAVFDPRYCSQAAPNNQCDPCLGFAIPLVPL
jgi:hypothetical protein